MQSRKRKLPLVFFSTKFDVRDPQIPYPETDTIYCGENYTLVKRAMLLLIRAEPERNRSFDPAWWCIFEIASHRYSIKDAIQHQQWFTHCLEAPEHPIRYILPTEDPAVAILCSDEVTQLGKRRLSFSTSCAEHLPCMYGWLPRYILLKHPKQMLWIFHPAE